jgi:transcriptional regulator with XRE-family HTH domain
MRRLTLQQLGGMSGVSSSHLGRIERGERFPSARVLRRIAQPLGFDEAELFTLADYLPQSVSRSQRQNLGRLNPYVARVLSQEPVEVQRAVIGILSLLKSKGKGVAEGGTPSDLPEFREYARRKYPNLDEDLITMIEDLIERHRGQSAKAIE